MSKMKLTKSMKIVRRQNHSAQGKKAPAMQKPKGGNMGCYGDKMVYPK